MKDLNITIEENDVDFHIESRWCGKVIASLLALSKARDVDFLTAAVKLYKDETLSKTQTAFLFMAIGSIEARTNCMHEIAKRFPELDLEVKFPDNETKAES